MEMHEDAAHVALLRTCLEGYCSRNSILKSSAGGKADGVRAVFGSPTAHREARLRSHHAHTGAIRESKRSMKFPDATSRSLTRLENVTSRQGPRRSPRFLRDRLGSLPTPRAQGSSEKISKHAGAGVVGCWPAKIIVQKYPQPMPLSLHIDTSSFLPQTTLR